jgi:hypothetical protein
MNPEPSQLEIEAYNRCFDSKHHYDNLSWTILGVSMAFSAVIAAFLPSISIGSYWTTVLARLGLAALGCISLQAWRQIYERNRFWGEVANETARNFERRYRVAGVAIAFMRANFSKSIVLTNTDSDGQAAAPPASERCRQSSMHFRAPLIAHAATIVLLLECFLPKSEDPKRLTMRCSEPGHRVQVAIERPRGPGR